MNKTDKRKILFLRISYWTGAVLDAFWIVPMLVPKIGFRLLGVEGILHDSPEYRYAMALAAALMTGWTILLIWADRKPAERRGVLLLTIVPVKVMLDLANLYLLYYKILTPGKFLVMRFDAVLLYGLFIFSYVYSRNLSGDNSKKTEERI